MIAQTPEPPYYAVIFTSIRTEVDEGYSDAAEKMLELAHEQEGFLGAEFARNELGINISYWRDLESIRKWKENSEHQFAQDKGKTDWYKSYRTRIALVEKDYGFENK